MEHTQTVLSEEEARALHFCPSCGEEKSVGAVVCWGDCWRGEQGLKYSGMSIKAWFEQYGITREAIG